MPRIDNVASQEGLEEAEAFCRLMVTNTIGELLEPSKRAQMPPNFNYRRLIVILAKYRCCDLPSTPGVSAGRCGLTGVLMLHILIFQMAVNSAAVHAGATLRAE